MAVKCTKCPAVGSNQHHGLAHTGCGGVFRRIPGRVAATPDPNMGAANPQPPVNPKTAQGAKKFSLRHIPLPAQVECNRALEDGVGKYGAANWRETGVPASTYMDAAKRHLDQWWDGGQERASDSGVHNLGHAMACLCILLDAQWNGTLFDDRPEPCKNTDELLKREVEP